MKSTLRIIILVLVTACAASAADVQDAADTFRPLLKNLAATPATVPASRFGPFTVALDRSLVADTARYSLAFQVEDGVLLADSLGGFVFSFPEAFDLSRAEVGALTHNSPDLQFVVQSTTISNNVVTIGVEVQGSPGPADTVVAFSLVVADVINPRAAGFYQVAGLAVGDVGQVLAGPALSSSFRILPRPIQTLTVIPAADTALAAGELLTFQAIGYDVYGNRISVSSAVWSLTADSDPIGSVSGSTLRAQLVGTGRMQATASGLSATSGLIRVAPGPLAHLDVDLPIQQLVGHPLFGPATVTLRDVYGNLCTGHDLTTEPLVLNVGTGVLTPSVIDNNTFISAGVVDLRAAGVSYRGPTAQTTVTAEIGGVVFADGAVSFSGYDLLGVLAEDGQPLTGLPANATTAVRSVVRNSGSLTARSPVTIAADFLPEYLSAGGYTEFAGRSNGATDTVLMQISTIGLPSGAVTMRLGVRSNYEVGGQVYEVVAAETLTVAITESVGIELVSAEIGPDTLYPGAFFPVAFDVRVTGLAVPMDSSRISIALDGIATEVYSGLATGVAGEGGLVSYTGITAIAPETSLGAARYALRYQVYAGAQTYEAMFHANTTIVLDPVNLAYVAGTLHPALVAGGYQTSFSFEVILGGAYPIELQEVVSEFVVQGNNFAASANLRSAGGAWAPGVNSVRVEALYVPESQIGVQLIPSARAIVYVPSAQVFDTVALSFGGESISVRDLGVTQIVDVEVVAPGAPNVNTSQEFRLRCLVANLSSIEVGPLVLRLTSDGHSTYDTMQVVAQIAPEDTAEVYFGCVAASEPSNGEIFRVQAQVLAFDQAVVQPAENDLALVRIQRPAELSLVPELQGLAGDLVDHNTLFGFTIEIWNQGEAATDTGYYRLLTGGEDFGAADTIEGLIPVGKHLQFQFVSPPYDTTVTFEFQLTRVPFDLNVLAPAIIDSARFRFTVRVESQDADLYVTAAEVGMNLVSPGEDKELLRIELTNRGTSTVSAIRLDRIRLAVRDRGRRPTEASRFFEVGRTVVLGAEGELSTEVSLTEQVSIAFSGLTIASGQTKWLVVRGGFTNAPREPFTLELDTDGLDAAFQGGTHNGFPVRVTGPDGPYLFSRTYVMRGRGLEESFVVENNPFNPNEGPAQFAFEIIEPSEVEFRVFTLTGELVYSEDIPEGTMDVAWDGRNDEGGMVANGVYVATVRVVRSGEEARMKVAVVK